MKFISMVSAALVPAVFLATTTNAINLPRELTAADQDPRAGYNSSFRSEMYLYTQKDCQGPKQVLTCYPKLNDVKEQCVKGSNYLSFFLQQADGKPLGTPKVDHIAVVKDGQSCTFKDNEVIKYGQAYNSKQAKLYSAGCHNIGESGASSPQDVPFNLQPNQQAAFQCIYPGQIAN